MKLVDAAILLFVVPHCYSLSRTALSRPPGSRTARLAAFSSLISTKGIYQAYIPNCKPYKIKTLACVYRGVPGVAKSDDQRSPAQDFRLRLRERRRCAGLVRFAEVLAGRDVATGAECGEGAT